MEEIRSFYNQLYNRPTIQLAGFARHHGLDGPLFAHLNYGGATGSAKDALAEAMLALATERGSLRPGQPVVEASGGSFAVSLAIAASHSGHPVHLVVPGSTLPGRQSFLASLGAKVAAVGHGSSRTQMVRRAQQIAEETGSYFVNYFSNDDNPEFHRRVTGPAILKATGGKVDTIVAGVGSGGTITGVGEYLKAWAGNVWVAAVQPMESPTLTGGFAGAHSITGIGPGFVPDNYNPYVVDEVVSVSGGDAQKTAHEVLFTDAVPASISGGAVLCAAGEIMRRRPGRTLCIFNGMMLYE